MGKGKLKALQLIMMYDNNAFRDAFSNLGHCDLVALADFADIEKFTFALYGLPKLSKINDARFVLLKEEYSPKKPGDSLGKISELIPAACHSVLLESFTGRNTLQPCEKMPYYLSHAHSEWKTMVDLSSTAHIILTGSTETNFPRVIFLY